MRDRLSTDRDWLIPAVFLTVACGIIAVVLSPSLTFLTHAMSTPLGCAIVAWVIGSLWLTYRIVAARPASPLREAKDIIVTNQGAIIYLALVVIVASLGLTVFTWAKSLLNLYVPFWADPLMADIDATIFFGHDPWRFVSWLNFPLVGHIYHRSWFFAIIGVLLIVGAAKPSPERSAVMLGYFILWLVAGPLIHIALPAGGPIFFENLGYGPRFSGMALEPETLEVAQYLWQTFEGKGSVLGSGISAMPSLHVTMVAWMALALRIFAPPLFGFSIVYGALIFLLSVALGWHYAVDGVVGVAAAVVCHLVLVRIMKSRGAGQQGSSRELPSA